MAQGEHAPEGTLPLVIVFPKRGAGIDNRVHLLQCIWNDIVLVHNLGCLDPCRNILRAEVAGRAEPPELTQGLELFERGNRRELLAFAESVKIDGGKIRDSGDPLLLTFLVDSGKLSPFVQRVLGVKFPGPTPPADAY